MWNSLNTDPYDLIIVGKCDILGNIMRHSPGWLIQSSINLLHHVSLKRVYDLFHANLLRKSIDVEKISFYYLILKSTMAIER